MKILELLSDREIFHLTLPKHPFHYVWVSSLNEPARIIDIWWKADVAIDGPHESVECRNVYTVGIGDVTSVGTSPRMRAFQCSAWHVVAHE